MPKKLSHASRIANELVTEESRMEMCHAFCELADLNLPDPIPTNSKDFARAIRKAVKDPCIKEEELYKVIRQISSPSRDR